MHLNNHIKQIIDSIIPLSSFALNMIQEQIRIERFKKGSDFIKKGKTNKNEYFVLEGVCKSYLVNPEGEEITISFFTENSILSPFTTRTSKGVSILNFQALTDLELASIDASVFEQLMVENLEVRNFGNTVLRNELQVKVNKEIGLASLTARERLINFRKHFPQLENIVPHTDIATYLGITNISLSRLRKDLMK
jgi:CRP-like cAMP-binding protein